MTAKQKTDDNNIAEMLARGMSKAEIAEELGVSRQTVYNRIKSASTPKKRGRKPMTEEQKAAAKEQRQKELAENPDKYKKKEWSMEKADSLKGGAMQSLERYCTATNEEIAGMMTSVFKWYELGKIAKPQNDDEVEERMKGFFQFVSETGEKPSVEKLALAVGVTVRALEYWREGQRCSIRRQELTRMAYTVLQAMDAELVNNNKLPVVSYIFRAKNFFGMKDQTEVNFHHNTKQLADEAELRKRITESVIIDADFDES